MFQDFDGVGQHHHEEDGEDVQADCGHGGVVGEACKVGVLGQAYTDKTMFKFCFIWWAASLLFRGFCMLFKLLFLQLSEQKLDHL